MLDDERSKIYKVLAAILHLGNIDFEGDVLTEKSRIIESTAIHLSYAAQLLEIGEEILKKSLLTRKMEVPGSDPIV